MLRECIEVIGLRRGGERLFRNLSGTAGKALLVSRTMFLEAFFILIFKGDKL